MLRRKNRATLAEIMEKMGWLPGLRVIRWSKFQQHCGIYPKFGRMGLMLKCTDIREGLRVG